MTNILISGGAGFIGSNLASMLSKDKENTVVVFDDFSLGCFENLQDLKFDGKIVMGDIRDTRKLNENIEKYKIEQIYHLAASSASPMFKNPTKATKINIIGTLNVLESARKYKVKRVVYASTSTVYAALEPPYSEDMPIIPQNFYAATKLSNEHCAKLYDKEGWCETVGCRFFSVYGANDAKKGKYANFFTQFLIGMSKGEQPIIYGDGKQSRDFIFVEDICTGLIKAMNTEGVSGEVFNLGTGEKINILYLVKKINELLGTDIKPKFQENPIKGYVIDHQARMVKTNALLGFKAQTNLFEGLKKMQEIYL